MPNRLPVLLALLGVLVLLRIFYPPGQMTEPVLAEAITRLPSSGPTAKEPAAPATGGEQAVALHEIDDVPGNAFAVRAASAPASVLPPAPVVAVARPVAIPPSVVMPPSLPSQPPLLPFQVIGTWNDGKQPGVFLASATGVLLARPGAVLQSEYKVLDVTSQQVSFVQIATQREFKLAVPVPSGSPSPQPGK